MRADRDTDTALVFSFRRKRSHVFYSLAVSQSYNWEGKDQEDRATKRRKLFI